MIVRVMTDNQYRLGDDQLPEVQRLDDALETAINSNDAHGFQTTLRELIALVKQHGEPVPVDEIMPSELIIPAPDMSLGEARDWLHPVEATQPPTGE